MRLVVGVKVRCAKHRFLFEILEVLNMLFSPLIREMKVGCFSQFSSPAVYKKIRSHSDSLPFVILLGLDCPPCSRQSSCFCKYPLPTSPKRGGDRLGSRYQQYAKKNKESSLTPYLFVILLGLDCPPCGWQSKCFCEYPLPTSPKRGGDRLGSRSQQHTKK